VEENEWGGTMKEPWFHIVCELEGEVRPTPTIHDIQRVVLSHFVGVTMNDILSPRRTNGVTMPRHIAIYLSRMLTRKSCPAIGRAFGDRDHTTVLSAISRIERLRAADAVFAGQIDNMVHSLGGCAA
jgi:chromosomal replication initiator protein